MAANHLLLKTKAEAIAKIVAANALDAVVGNLVMGGLVNRDYDGSLAQSRRYRQHRNPPGHGGLP